MSIPGTPSQQGKTVKLGNLDDFMLEKGNSKTKFFWGKGEVFLEFYSLLLFLLHVGNKGKAREVLPKVLEKLL